MKKRFSENFRSVAAFMNDHFLFAYFLIFVGNETSVRFPYLFLAGLFIISFFVLITKQLGFGSIAISTGIIILVYSLLFFLSAPIWMIFLCMFFSIWRAVSRLTTPDFDQTNDGVQISLLFSAFIVGSLLATFLPFHGEQIDFIIITALAIVIFVSFKIVENGLVAKESTTLDIFPVLKLLGGALSFLVVICVLLLLFSKSLIEGFFQLTGGVFVGLFSFIGKIGDAIRLWIVSLIDPQKASGLKKPVQGTFEMTDYEAPTLLDPSTIPFTGIGVTVGILLLVVIFYRYWKNREPVSDDNSLLSQQDSSDIHQETHHVKVQEDAQYVSTYDVSLNEIREAYRAFEQEAMQYGYYRSSSETVKEWFGRESWKVESSFFHLYEEARYRSGSVAHEKADRFFEELKKIKNFFRKDV
ncbi:hypothetical protein [Paenisporosarcina cavernae]|uniref:DUF4129 domain-containing protein n=1 Tax=Paenisporosarcina cavernae TaxID=2320858 RepID=A0A385YTS2_9BACL|nr:hypothetical protein [Paenisporosarcina cavernae]AYC29068.1 hypothetical protein D3873_03945 [Paenisporosarcina cavernae]